MLINARLLGARLAAGLAFVVFAFWANVVHAAEAVPLSATPDWVSSGLANGACLVWGDLDGDGDLDMIPGEAGMNLLLYLNDGIDRQGALRFSTQTLAAGKVSSCALGDMDRDGRLDIVVGASEGPTRVFLNRGVAVGAPTFVDSGWLDPHPTQGPGKRMTAAVSLADINGDGWLDLGVGSGDLSNTVDHKAQTDYVYRNDSQGGAFRLTEVWASAPQSTRSTLNMAWGDINGDGRVDFLASGGWNVQLYRVTNGRPGPIPSATLSVNSALPRWETSKAVVDWGDMDGDRDLDLAVGSPAPGDASAPLRVYINDGRGAIWPSPIWQSAEKVNVWSLSWGDVDNDADLDLAVGYRNAPTSLYLNLGSVLDRQPGWSAANASAGLTVVAWADVDNDGDLDLSQVSKTDEGSPAFIYLNRGRPLPGAPDLESDPKDESSTAAAWGDVDDDGRLELAVGRSAMASALDFPWSAGNRPAAGLLYKVENNWLIPAPELWSPANPAVTTSLAWGDADGDDALDLALGNVGQTQVYLNRGGALQSTPALTLGDAADKTVAVAWGDINGDAALDLVVARHDQPAQLYLNKRGPDPAATLLNSPDWLSAESGPTSDLALGDLNNDGALDLVLADFGPAASVRVYLNRGGALPTAATAIIPGANAYSVALGDMNRDGYLDLAIGVSGGPKQVHLNDGGRIAATPAWVSGDADWRSVVAWGDVNGDGFPDLAAGNAVSSAGAGPDKVYLNQGGVLDRSASWSADVADNTLALAWGDANGDGLLDLASVTGLAPETSRGAGIDKVYLNRGSGGAATASGAPRVSIDPRGDAASALAPAQAGTDAAMPAALAPADFYATSAIRNTGVISITYTLGYSRANAAGAPMRLARALYSPNGGGAWFPAIRAGAATNEITQTVTGGPLVPGSYVYAWDVFASGFLGQSDNVVFRLEAYPSVVPAAGSAANSFRTAVAATQTYPFRVRGSQVRVVDEAGQPAAGALVYRLPPGQAVGGLPVGVEDGGLATTTNLEGYLQGQGRILAGERLVALQPISATSSYTLYHTSAAPTLDGLDAYTATATGAQTLVTSGKNPLMLFNLDVSLEWDATGDGSFLDDLGRAIRQSSQLLYQVTAGQAALGDVRVHQAGENWLTADMVVYADNSVRPSASIGGVVSGHVSDRLASGRVIPDAFIPGQIRVGPNWDPFGESREDLSEDWWRALAHEYGHYLLFLPDNYLGLDPAGYLTRAQCRGSFMTTAYDPTYSRFLYFPNTPPEQWPGGCADTLAAKLTGRSDWETILQFYPALSAPVNGVAPQIMPFDFTRVMIQPVEGESAVIPARNYDLRSALTGRSVIARQGRAYLFKTKGTPELEDDTVVALGATGGKDFIKVRGAEPGDQLCALDTASEPARVGCEEIGEATASIDLTNFPRVQDQPGWQPNIDIKPVFQPTTVISVTWPGPGDEAAVTLGSSYDPLPAYALMAPVAPGQPYTLTLSQPAGVITFTRPITVGEPYVTVVLEPALLITVTQKLDGGPLNAQVFPGDGGGGAAPWRTLQAGDLAQPDVYTATIPLHQPALSGYVRVWVGEPAKTAVSQFFLGPVWPIDLSRTNSQGGANARGGIDIQAAANVRGGVDWRVAGANARGGVDARGEANARGGVDARGEANARGGAPIPRLGELSGSANVRGGVDLRAAANVRGGANAQGGANARGGSPLRSWGAAIRAYSAPMPSADGHVTIFNARDIFGDTGTSSLQVLASIPGLPSWLTPVGQAYRYDGSDNIERNISFGYLQRDVPAGYEYGLQLYYSPDEGRTWRMLPSQINPDENRAVARMPGSGLYVLAGSVDIPLAAAGWHLVAYPVPEARSLPAALTSIDGAYTTVYAYDMRDPENPWRVYDTSMPGWANDLQRMEFGQGYWIQATKPVTLQLAIPPSVVRLAPLPAPSREFGQFTPPATYYGTISLIPGSALPTVLEARVGDVVCGRGEILPVPGSRESARYRVKVSAASAEGPDCGAPGRPIEFWASLEGNPEAGIKLGADVWSDPRPKELPLRLPE